MGDFENEPERILAIYLDKVSQLKAVSWSILSHLATKGRWYLILVALGFHSHVLFLIEAYEGYIYLILVENAQNFSQFYDCQPF